eukprot:TRINITY_DN1397_c0_g1_i1.p1 TRINITY_DN1397_c0_g1~~TRINITY_DN1397_c0_g1_i1.p1  ORF type:complete len:502 (-),score=191.33 TRINITY_DN1397_c0_g1_i1:71-1576(-)
MSLKTTQVNQVEGIVSEIRRNFDSRITIPLSFRREQLNALKRCILENQSQWAEGVVKDLKMDKVLQMNETILVAEEIDFALDHLDEWTAKESRPVPAVQKPAKGYIVSEPLGVVLIISPWNYPVSLALKPMIGAIAAGNAVIIKPSEVSIHTSNNFYELLPKYLDKRVFTVIAGGVQETTEVLKYKFDHIMYTGNGTVAKIIAKAAAEHLTPLTLELGGKSPLILDDTFNVSTAAGRIAWGKYTNAGQTCVSPDYALVKRNVYDSFLQEMKKTILKYYGEDPSASSDYGKIINSRHCKRLEGLMKDLEIYHGGVVDSSKDYISPTIVKNPPLDCPLMNDEIFGPIFPVIPYDNLEEVISLINSKPKPLALYVFSTDSKLKEEVLSRTSAGGGCVNEVVCHVICPELPFGGVGESGMGSYNSKQSFDTFCNKRGILERTRLPDPDIRFPPFTDFKLGVMKWMFTFKGPSFKKVSAVVVAVAAVALYFVGTDKFRDWIKTKLA